MAMIGDSDCLRHDADFGSDALGSAQQKPPEIDGLGSWRSRRRCFQTLYHPKPIAVETIRIKIILTRPILTRTFPATKGLFAGRIGTAEWCRFGTAFNSTPGQACHRGEPPM